MPLSDRAEEMLENLWGRIEQDKQDQVDLGIARGEPEIDELLKASCIRLAGEKITLTEKGRIEGEKIIRRHRLAERLFTDVLDVKGKLVHGLSCKFEHLLHEGVEDNVCTLLGHPETCPHGRAIPPGECCRKFKEHAGKVVSSLARLSPRQKGKVAYVNAKDQKKLQKLIAMGVLPGMTVSLIQKFPSYVFQIGQSQFAIDEELAECVFIRTEPTPEEPRPPFGRFRLRGRRRGV